MRSWTLIVSVGVHVLGAAALTHVPAAMSRAAEAQRIEAVEIAMVETPRPEPKPEPREASQTPPAPRPQPEPGPRPRPQPGPPAPPGGAPAASGEPSGPAPMRSLSMRRETPERGDQAPTIVLGGGPIGQAAHDFGLQIGAPLVNMHDPFENLKQTGDGPIGHATGGGRYKKKTPQFRADIDPDGKVHFHDSPMFTDVGGYASAESNTAGLTMHFDLTDELMRAHGMDPYWAAKLRYLDETRDERDAMAIVDRGEKLRDALARLPGFLEAIWRDTRYSAEQRRLVLFQLWDECAEDGPEEVVRVAGEVRLTIEAFVRRRLPLGSPDCFVDEELARLNAGRSSKLEFRPYTAAP